MITETQSYSWVIRNVFLDALATVPFFAGFTLRRTRMLQFQPHLVPYLGVYLIKDQMEPDGDGNAGHIRFKDMLQIGFSVWMADNDPDVLEAKLDQAWWAIMNRLWPDQYIMNLLDTRGYPAGAGKPDNTRIESVQRGERRMNFGTMGSSNETPVGEMQYEVACFYRAGFAPVITDELLEIDVTTKLKPDSPTVLSKYIFAADPAAVVTVPSAAMHIAGDAPAT